MRRGSLRWKNCWRRCAAARQRAEPARELRAQPRLLQFRHCRDAKQPQLRLSRLRLHQEIRPSRQALEKVRIASSKVLGRAVRVCAKLEAVAAAAASASRASLATQELRAQFERDPMVKSMLQRFGGKITEVKHRPEET